MSSILVVDDDLILRSSIERTLRQHGFEVRVSDDASSAMQLIQHTVFDVLITDLRLQDESGIDLIRETSRISARTRPVLMSAFATARDHQVATELGAVRVLSKPFTMDDLLGAVRHAIEAEDGFRGTIHGLSLVDLLQMYHFARRSVAVLTSGATSGEVLVENGEIVHARSGAVEGEGALRELLGEAAGAVRTQALPASVPRTIERAFDSLLLDALRVRDEQGRSEDEDWIEKITFRPAPIGESSSAGDALEMTSARAAARAGPEEGRGMGKIDDACRDVVGKVEGATACGVVDLDTGMLLGLYNAAGYTQTLNEIVAAATTDLFRGPNVARVEQMVRAHRGVPENGESYFQEVHISSTHNYHFAKTIKGGKAVIMLVTKKTTNIGMGWAMLKSVIPSVEPHVP